MPKTRKNHPPSLKAKVAVEAIKAHKTSAQIAQMFAFSRPKALGDEYIELLHDSPKYTLRAESARAALAGQEARFTLKTGRVTILPE